MAIVINKADHATNKAGEKLAVRELLRSIRALTARGHNGYADLKVYVNAGIIQRNEGGPIRSVRNAN